MNLHLINTDRDWKAVLGFAMRFTHAESRRLQEYELEQLHEGHFPLVQLPLPLPGKWTAVVTLTRADAGETRFAFEFVLSHP